jgi:hypothetical protein
MKTFLSILALTLLFLAGCQKNEIPVNPQDDLSLNKNAVPMKITFDGLALIGMPPTPECGNMLPRTTINGEGNCTHLGKFTSLSVACIVPDGTIPTNGTFINGTHIVTAANGEKMFSEWTGSYETDVPNDIVHYVFNMTITGGTGKFTGAEGTMSFTASAPYGGPAAPKQAHAEGQGYIEYKNLKPFIGKVVGYSDVSTTYACSPGALAKFCVLEGNTNLGYSDAFLEHCNLVTGMDGGLLLNGTGTLTTPDGELHCSYDKQKFIFDQYPPTTATFPDFYAEIIGGTGKYLNAKGTMIASGVQTLTPSGPSPLEMDFKGWLIK